VDDIKGVLYGFLTGSHIPLLHQFRELASLGRVQEKIQPGGALGSSALPALPAALDGGQLLARSCRPTGAAFWFIHDLWPKVLRNTGTLPDIVTGHNNYFSI
jgi:hypothetical protein